MFEGIGKYILGIFIIYLIAYVVKKIEMAKIFKKANVKKMYAYIPFKCTKELINISHASPKLFPLTFIPFVHINAYINIYKEMLKTFGQDPKEAIYYYFMPMVYFTKLGSGHARVEIHDYDLNNEYLEAQSMLYEPVIGETEAPLYDMTDPGYYIPEEKKERVVYRVARNNQNVNATIPEVPSMQNIETNLQETKPEIKEKTVMEIKENNFVENPFEVHTPQVKITSEVPQNNIQINNEGPKTVFTDTSLEPDKRQEKIVEVEKKEEEKINPIKENITGRPQMCPKCGAKLAPGVKVCFLCGTQL